MGHLSSGAKSEGLFHDKKLGQGLVFAMPFGTPGPIASKLVAIGCVHFNPIRCHMRWPWMKLKLNLLTG